MDHDTAAQDYSHLSNEAISGVIWTLSWFAFTSNVVRTVRLWGLAEKTWILGWPQTSNRYILGY